MVKEQVDVKRLPIDFELHQASHEGEAAAQLQQKIAKMLEQPTRQPRSLALELRVRNSNE